MGQTIDDLDPLQGHSNEEAFVDYVKAVASLGLIDMYEGAKSLHRGDFSDTYYNLYIAGMAHATWYTMYKAVVLYEPFVKGRAVQMSFHQMMASRGPLLGQAARSLLRTAAGRLFLPWALGKTLQYIIGPTDYSHAVSGSDVSHDQWIELYTSQASYSSPADAYRS
jgi:hypothetical protein